MWILVNVIPQERLDRISSSWAQMSTWTQLITFLQSKVKVSVNFHPLSVCVCVNRWMRGNILFMLCFGYWKSSLSMQTIWLAFQWCWVMSQLNTSSQHCCSAAASLTRFYFKRVRYKEKVREGTTYSAAPSGFKRKPFVEKIILSFFQWKDGAFSRQHTLLLSHTHTLANSSSRRKTIVCRTAWQLPGWETRLQRDCEREEDRL